MAGASWLAAVAHARRPRQVKGGSGGVERGGIAWPPPPGARGDDRDVAGSRVGRRCCCASMLPLPPARAAAATVVHAARRLTGSEDSCTAPFARTGR